MMCMATLVNGYLFVPWLVKPFPFLDAENLDHSQGKPISDSITAQEIAHGAEPLVHTEHDAREPFRFEPIKKRRHQGGEEIKQGRLF